MKLSNQLPLPVDQARAWEALNDLETLKVSIPGCESLEQTGENQFELTILTAIGPVRARFKGRLMLSNLSPPTSYEIDFEGQGGVAGHGKGRATVRLESTGLEASTLHYSAEASVGGKIAQIGQRLVDMAAQRMANEFFSNFKKNLVSQPADEDEAPKRDFLGLRWRKKGSVESVGGPQVPHRPWAVR
jgi:carbon monoxide dehydrogenase subunit G